MTNEQISLVIAQELGVRPEQVARTIALLDEENTLPFIARYRKEVTGGLDEEQIRTIQTRLEYLRNLAERKETVLTSILEQGKLTPELQAQIEAATTLQRVEDLYLPYRPKRRTRATIARERGLQPLADRILAQAREKVSPEQAASAFLTQDVPAVADALQGARDIVAETVTEQAEIRAAARAMTEHSGTLLSTLADAAKDPQKTYQTYYDYREPLQRIPPHRLLAINRGEQAGALSVRIDLPAEPVLADIERRVGVNERSPWAGELRVAIAEGYKRLLAPAVERDVRGCKTESSEAHAIQIFGTNLRNLLLQPPLRGKCVLGIDPGIRTGCKLALVDQTGKYVGGTTIYPHEPRRDWNGAKQTIKTLIERGQVNVIAIGNGTASRETEQLVAEAVRETGGKVAYAIVSEAGASVYSASPLARAELPELDVAMRGAVSIARRLQDPLAELVKIDPKSIGVGLYQHDVDQKALGAALDGVVESSVNRVGVDLNTASPALLKYVAGLTNKTAEAMVVYRNEHGPYARRKDILKVKGLGPKAFEQAAGFLKLPESPDPRENTLIHPESYPVVDRLFALMDVRGNERDLPQRVATFRAKAGNIAALAKELEVGVPTLNDILEALERPGRDPREDAPPVVLRTDVRSIDDLSEGMILTGTVRNVVDFGAFVDIGVKQDGLVHVSEMGDRFVRNPLDVVAAGDIVEVRVIKIDKERGRIGLSMKGTGIGHG